MKERITKIIFSVLALCVIFCGWNVQAASSVLSEHEIVLEVNENYTLKASTSKKVSWSSTSDILVLNEKGKEVEVTALKPGKAKVYARVGNRKECCKVTVLKKAFSRRRSKSMFRAPDGTFTWDKVPGAEGYQIYEIKPGGKKQKLFKTIRDGNITRYRGKKNIINTKSTFNIRAYRRVNGKIVYSKWAKRSMSWPIVVAKG